MIWVRLHAMRRDVEAVIGRLGASFYTSATTKFIESGALFTVWSIIYLILRTRGSFAQEVFLRTYTYILVRVLFRYPFELVLNTSTATGYHANANHFSYGPRSGLVKGYCYSICTGGNGLAGFFDA